MITKNNLVNKEYFYRIIIVILLAAVLVMGLVMIFKKPAKEIIRLPFDRVTKLSKSEIGKIAIVIDDVGYNLDNLNIIKNIKYPVTFSILPGLAFSESAAQELNSRGFQIILHLPMEPKEKKKLEINTILTSMDETLIRSIIENDLTALPGVKGVSNHMGSKFTEDEKTMSVVFDELKSKNLFFLDSFVTANSVAKQVAEKKRLRFTRRDVFLDNFLDPNYIRQQILLLKQKARLKGQAVGIGHDRKITLEVLKEEMPKMEKEGYKLVFVFELAR